MVAATVDVVTEAHIVREGILSRLVDITGETGLPGQTVLLPGLYFWRWNLYSFMMLSFVDCADVKEISMRTEKPVYPLNTSSVDAYVWNLYAFLFRA